MRIIHPLENTLKKQFNMSLLLNKCTYPNILIAGKENTISFTWENKGVTYTYEPYKVGVELMDANRAIQYVAFPTQCKRPK